VQGHSLPPGQIGAVGSHIGEVGGRRRSQ